MNDDTAARKTGTVLKGIDEEKCSKERDRRVEASDHRGKAKDAGGQVLEHEALDRGWAWLVLLGASITGVSHVCTNKSRLTRPP